MNALTTQPSKPSTGYSATADIAVELAKMLALVAPITMTTEQQELWLRAAVDALQDIGAAEVRDVSAEIRRSVTRPSQIVPEIARLVAENRSRRSRINEIARLPEGPPPVKHIMERDRSKFTAADWRELSAYLEGMGSPVRYHSDGERYEIGDDHG